MYIFACDTYSFSIDDWHKRKFFFYFFVERMIFSRAEYDVIQIFSQNEPNQPGAAHTPRHGTAFHVGRAQCIIVLIIFNCLQCEFMIELNILWRRWYTFTIPITVWRYGGAIIGIARYSYEYKIFPLLFLEKKTRLWGWNISLFMLLLKF